MKDKKQLTETMLKQLKNPFDPKFIKWRVGATNADKTKGIALAYLDVREVYKRLDDVCGLDGWADKLIGVNEGFICELSIRMPDGSWVTKSDSADYTDVEAIKGGASSAVKRAGAVFGIGRYLYYLPTMWVPIKKQGNSYILAEIPELPNWALPNAVERWEDVAELQLTITQDETETPEEDIDEVTDRIAKAYKK